jgi:hypothetical protein
MIFILLWLKFTESADHGWIAAFKGFMDGVSGVVSRTLAALVLLKMFDRYDQ